MDPESLAHSRYILIWACNMISTNLHLWPFVAEAQRRGAKVVVIDPVRHRTASHADWYIPIRPGTDGALALALMNVIIGEGLADEAYVRDYTVGYDELAERVAQYTPEWGDNRRGQLGNGGMASSPVPVKVAGLSQVTGISAGFDASMATRASGISAITSVWTWGGNDFGQLGDGTLTSHSTPERVTGLPLYIAGISAGGGFAARLGDGGISATGGFATVLGTDGTVWA